MDKTYATYVPYVFCCPVCRNVHETKRDMAECLMSGRASDKEQLARMEDLLR